MTAHVILVANDAAVQEMITVNLEQAGYRLQCAADMEKAWQLLGHRLPDLLLLDTEGAEANGVEFVRRIRSNRRTQQLGVIVINSRGEEGTLAALESGSDDCIGRPVSPRELNARIRALLRRRVPQATDNVVEAAGLRLDPARRRVSGRGEVLGVGRTEFRLLHFLMTHAERVYSRAELLDTVWGDDVFVEERTVDVHIQRLRVALEQSGHDHLVQTVRGAGYRFSLVEPEGG